MSALFTAALRVALAAPGLDAAVRSAFETLVATVEFPAAPLAPGPEA